MIKQPPDEKQRWQALATIIRESQRLRDLAKANGDDFLAYLLENVLHEARSTLLGAGQELPKDKPDAGSAPVVLPFKPKPKQR